MDQQISYFDPIKFGDLIIPNRIVMSSVLRMRADPQDGVPTDAHVKHYSDRADFGLMLTEMSSVSEMGEGFPGTCGIYTEGQIAGWKKVVEKVHEKGGRIFLYLNHCGRATDSAINHQQEIWGPSAIPLSGDHPNLKKHYQIPKSMTLEDIQLVIKQFRKGAENAQMIGFDGVQLHGAYGFLIDQFLKDASNKRTDEYGGSVENRCRLCLEIIDELISVYGAKRIGIKLTPCSEYNFNTTDSNPIALYNYLVKQLDLRGIAFIEFKQIDETKQISNCCQQFRNLFSGTLIAHAGYDVKSGLEIIQSGDCDMVSFGKLPIANPDLVKRIQNQFPLNPKLDLDTWFSSNVPGQADPGYNDYPTYEQEIESYKNRKYFEQIKVCDFQIPNRIVFEGLALKNFDTKDGIPNEFHLQYYSDYSQFGIILTECVQIITLDEVFTEGCGINSEQQINGWKRVVEQVHENCGKIIIRIGHYLKSHMIPKEMTKQDIQIMIQKFRIAAENAKKAGFDGIELLATEGFIIDKFIQEFSNERIDEYGGSIQNRCRVCLEILDALIEVFGYKKTGIMINLGKKLTDQDPQGLFIHLITQLEKKRISFIQFSQNQDTDYNCSIFRHLFSGIFIANNFYCEKSALELIRIGAVDLICFDKLISSNPEIIKKIQDFQINTKF